MAYKTLLIIFSGIIFCFGISAQQVQTVVQTGHYSEVTTVCYSPDGYMIATGSSDKTVKLWRRSDGRQIRSYQGNTSEIEKVSINSKITALLAVDSEGTLTVWDLNTGDVIRQIRQESDRFTCAAFHPDGSKIITGSRKSFISVWDLQTGNRTMEIRAVPATHEYARGYEYPESGSAVWSIDGRYIVAGVADFTAILWDAETGKEIRKFKKENSTCTSCISEAAITPDNKYIVLAGSDSIRIFNRETGLLVRSVYGQGGSPEGLVISSDGKLAGAIEYGVAEIWDLATGKLMTKAGDYSERKVLGISNQS